MPYSDILCSWLVRSALVSLTILLVGSGAVLVWRQPVRRVRIIELVLAGCLIAPLLGMIPGYPQLSVAWWHAAETKKREAPLPAPVGPRIEPAMMERAVPEPMRFPALDRGTPPVPDTKTMEAPTHAIDIRPWIVGIYLAGVAIGIGWWLAGIVGLARILWASQPAPSRCRELLTEISAGRSDRVRLLVSRRLSQPFASAWGRAMIVLPENLCGDEQSLRWCLAHEWAHVDQRDFRTWLLAGLVRVLFFYQPLLWWLRRQLRLCQDLVADAQAALQGPQVEDYADFLTARAAAGSSHPMVVGLSMTFRKSELYRRVIMLLKNESLESRTPRLWTISVTVAALVLVSVVAAVSLVPRAVAEERPAVSQSKEGGGKTKELPQEVQVGTSTTSGFVTITTSASGSEKSVPVSETGEEIVFTPPADVAFWFRVYTPLGYEKIRKDDLGITAQQQEKLRKIHQNYMAESKKLGKATQKETAQLPLPERQAKMFAAWKPLDSRTCKEIEEVLTASQLATLRNLVLCEYAFQLANPSFGLSAKQIEQYARLRSQEMAQMEQSYRENEEKSFAVLSPQQREQLGRQNAKTDLLQSAFFAHPSFMFVTPPGVGEVYYHALEAGLDRKELAVSDQQWTKLRAIFQSQTAQELYKFHEQVFAEMYNGNRAGLKSPEAKKEAKKEGPKTDHPPVKATEGFTKTGTGMMGVGTTTVTSGGTEAIGSLLEQRLAIHPAIQQKWKKLEKELRGQVEAVFTPEQLAALKKLALRKIDLQSLRNPRTLAEIAATEQQKEELRRLHEEKTWIEWRADHAAGAGMLNILTPQQRKKFVEKMERQNWSYYSPEDQSPGVKETSTTTKPASEGQQMTVSIASGSGFIASGGITSGQPSDATQETSAAKPVADVSPASDQPATKVTLAGTLRTSDGKPLSKKISFAVNAYTRTPDGGGAYDDARAQGVSFSMKVPSGKTWLFVGGCDEYAPALVGPISGKAGETISDIEMVFEKGFPQTIRVIDEKGEPVRDAAINARSRIEDRQLGDCSYSTDDKGIAVMPVSNAIKQYDLSVSKAGFQPLNERGVSIKPNQTVTLKVSHAKLVHGVVLSPGGRPIAGIEIREYIRDKKGGDTSLAGQNGTVLATTDVDGRFVLNELDDDATYLLVAECKEYGRKAFSLEPPFPKELSIKFGPVLTVSGIIRGKLDELAKENGRPSVSFRESFSSAVWKPLYGVDLMGTALVRSIDGEQRFTIGDLLPGKITIRAGKHIVQTKIDESEPSRQVTIDLTQSADQTP